MRPYTLHLEPLAADVLACVLLQAIDDLEARAVLCGLHDPDIGTVSVEEYRTDARRLRALLDVVAPGSRPAAPDRVAVRWIDGIWTISNGRLVRLHRTDDIQLLLESTLDLIDQHLIHPVEALTTIHDLTTTDIDDTNQIDDINETSHTNDTNDIHLHTHTTSPNDETDQPHQLPPNATSELPTSSPPTRQVLHRLASRCAAPARVGAGC